jgi:DNA-binding NtrC family response regulator
MRDATTRQTGGFDPPPTPSEPSRLAVVVVGCVSDAERLGEVLFVDRGAVVGRNGDSFLRQRPRSRVETGPIDDPQLSREQLRFDRDGTVRSVGRLPLFLDGRPVLEAPIRPGDLLRLGDRVLLMVTTRPEVLPGDAPEPLPWGGPDGDGWVGESPAAWRVRQQIAFVAERAAHVLVLGESGTGKELVARALHRRSPRSRGPLVTRSAATIPDSLADAELFGNLRGYPNPGMPGRPGLIGEADGGTLFLDEFGELPHNVQARLLRVLDAGEYSLLGEARSRRADLRLVAATNRDPEDLKHDVLARFAIRLQLPGLDERPEDIPLLANHLLRRIARRDPGIADRLFPDANPDRVPRIRLRLVERWLTARYHTHLRELEAQLWERILTSDDGVLDVAPEPPRSVVVAALPPEGPLDPATLTPEALQAALDRNGGRQEATWRELGLANRHVLKRLVAKYGLRVRGRPM